MTEIELDLQPLMDILKSMYMQLCMQTKELMEIKEELRLKAIIKNDI